MDKLENHEKFWGPAEELIDRAKRLQKVIGVNLKTITVRLVRYYSAEGVIDKPDRLGREAAYHYKHLLQLLLARRLSENGAMLADIKMLLTGQSVVELEGKLKDSINPLLDEIKRRRITQTAERVSEPSAASVTKEYGLHRRDPELEALTSQLNHVGKSLNIFSDAVDSLGKANLEIAAQNENLLNTINEVHYALRESIEIQKHTTASSDRLMQRIDNTEALARKQEIDLDLNLNLIKRTVEQLVEHFTRLQDSVLELAEEIRKAKN